MRLILRASSYYSDEYIYFEHEDEFSAKYELWCKIDKIVKSYPKRLSYEETVSLGETNFKFHNTTLTVREFVEFEELPGKNRFIPPKEQFYEAIIREPNIISLEHWFDNHKTKGDWKNNVHTVIKNKRNKVVDIALSKL